MANTEKKYGLIDPKKKMTVADVFNNDSDSGEERGGKDWIKKKLQKDAEKGVKKQTLIDMNRALQDDPTVYQYDEVYDTLKSNEAEVASKSHEERKVKYMSALLKTADRRKKENERRTERLVQKEREAEGEMFKDKEEFITSSYRHKLEEMKKAEEEEKKMEYIESVMDVTKQQDLSSFYRQLYKDTVPEGETLTTQLKDESEKISDEKRLDNMELKEDTKPQSSSSGSSGSDSSSDSSSTSDSSSAEEEGGKKKNVSTENTVVIENVEKIKPIIALEEVEINPTVDESKKVTIKRTDLVVESNENVAKFAISSRRDRTYRQREPLLQGDKDLDKERGSSSGQRKDDRQQLYRDDRSRNRDRGRDRDRAHREERRAGLAWRSEDRRRDNTRRERTRSGTRKEQDRGSRRNPERSDNKRSRERPVNEPSERKEKSAKLRNEDKEKKPDDRTSKTGLSSHDKLRKEEHESKSKGDKPTSNGKVELDKNKEAEKITEVDIWKKRTIGPVFDAALERYYQRKAARGC